MEMHQIRYFLAVVREGSFTRAAACCHVSQPALTRAVQKLEAEMGGLLLLRDRQQTLPTALGRALVPHLEQTLAAAEAALGTARHHGTQNAMALTVGLEEGLPGALLRIPLAEVQGQWPELSLTVRTTDGPALGQALSDGAVDVLVTTRTEVLPERAHRWALGSLPLDVVFPADHPLVATPSVTLETLRQTAVIQGPTEDPSWRVLSATTGPLSGPTAVGGEARDALLLAGAGVAIMPAARPVPEGLVQRPLVGVADLAVMVSVMAGRPLGPAASALLRLLRARPCDDAALPGLLSVAELLQDL